MRNFYYVLTFNLTHPVVAGMLDRLKVKQMNGHVVDYKVRSKLFVSFSEASAAAHADFATKAPLLFPEEKYHIISGATVMNPAFGGNSTQDVVELAKRFGMDSTNWDNNCCGAVFYTELADEQNDDDYRAPPNVMFKYEILFSEDAIEFTKNGDFAFLPVNVPRHIFNSTYH